MSAGFLYNWLMKHLILPVLLLMAPAAWSAPKKAQPAHVKKQAADVSKRKAPAAASAPMALTHSTPNFCIFGGQSGKALGGQAAFSSIVWRSDVVYIGETHDQPLDHQAQLEALKAMRIARGQKIAVGFEMLDLTQQAALDDYAAGKLGEADFLARTGWADNWGFDFAMYRPVFEFVRQNKLRALALNVPRAVVAKIARGGLESLSADERKLLPETVALPHNARYNDYLKASFGGHGEQTVQGMTLENYQASMAAWNEGMGARIADFLAANPGYEVLVLAGNGHLMYNAGIQASVKSSAKDLRQASFYTEDARTCPDAIQAGHKDIANYVWYMNHPPKPKPAAPPAASTAPAAAAEQRK